MVDSKGEDWVAGSRGGRRLFSVCLFEPCMYYLLSKNEKTDKTKYKTQLLLTQGDVGGRGRRQPRIRISGEVTGRTAPAAMTWAPQPCSPPTSHAHRENKCHVLRSPTSDQLWPLSSRELSVLCPVSRCDPWAMREKEACCWRLARTGGEGFHSPSWPTPEPSLDRWPSPPDMAVHWENRWTRGIGWGWRDRTERSKPQPSWHVLWVKRNLGDTFKSQLQVGGKPK